MAEPTLQEIAAAVADLSTATEEFKSANDKALELKANKGEIDSLLEEKIGKLQTVIEEKSAFIEKAGTELKATQDRLAQVETILERSGPGAADPKAELEIRAAAADLIVTDCYDMGRPIDLAPEDVDEVDLKAFKAYDKHFVKYIRHGAGPFLKAMGAPGLETKLLSVDRDPGGGYWVRPEISNRIVKFVFESSPVRQFATVETIGSDQLELMADESQIGFGWVAEQESRPETTTADIGKRVIHAHELYAEPRATQKLLDDAGFTVEGWLARKIGERFTRVEATAFVAGTGTGQPRGFTTYPDGTSTEQIEQIASGAANDVTFDGLINLIYSLKAPYQRNARFMAARLTLRNIRRLKDGQGRYLWELNNQVGQPAMLLGFPVHQADDMPSVSAGNLAIAFGDFKTAYTIVDRKGIRTLRDPFTAKPFIKFYTTRRVGGDVVNFEAIKLQDIAAS